MDTQCLFRSSEGAFAFYSITEEDSCICRRRRFIRGVDKDTAYNSVITPIYQTSTFRFADVGKTLGMTTRGRRTRRGRRLRKTIAVAGREGLERWPVATGMAAIATVLAPVQSSGDHIIVPHGLLVGGPDPAFSGKLPGTDSTSRSVTSTSTILPL